MKKIILIVMLLGAVQAVRAEDSHALDQMLTYADNAILDAAKDGQKKVRLTFGNTDATLVEKLADALEARGYKVDEEALLLNPEVVKVLGLKASAMAKNNAVNPTEAN